MSPPPMTDDDGMAVLLQRPASVAHPVPLPDALPFAIVQRITVALPLQAIEEIDGMAVQSARERGNSERKADVGGGSREPTSRTRPGPFD